MRIWIARLEISDAVERKIRRKHNLTGDEVREAIVARRDVHAYWENHSVHGYRIIVSSKLTNGTRLLVWLFPISGDIDTYGLVTARKESVG